MRLVTDMIFENAHDIIIINYYFYSVAVNNVVNMICIYNIYYRQNSPSKMN